VTRRLRRAVWRWRLERGMRVRRGTAWVLVASAALALLAPKPSRNPPFKGPVPHETVAPASQTLARSASWVTNRAVKRARVPNVVVASVIAEESGGDARAEGFNCPDGRSSSRPCPETYGVPIESADAGLMQINSGGWPKTPKWNRLHLGADPFDPEGNLAAGIQQLEADFRQYRYLKYALEAYHDGIGGPGSPGAAYAEAILRIIRQLESGPTVGIWRQGGRMAASAVRPSGRRFSIAWAPGEEICAGVGTLGAGTADCLNGRDLVVARVLTASIVRSGEDPALSLASEGGGSDQGRAEWIGNDQAEEGAALRITATWSRGEGGSVTVRVAP